MRRRAAAPRRSSRPRGACYEPLRRLADAMMACACCSDVMHALTIVVAAFALFFHAFGFPPRIDARLVAFR